MKTFLIATESNLANHAGEEYDDYMTVQAMVQPEQMPAVANDIRNRLRALIVESQAEGDLDENHIKVDVDAPPLYDVILVSLVDTMGKEEKLNVELPVKLTRGNAEESVLHERERRDAEGS